MFNVKNTIILLLSVLFLSCNQHKEKYLNPYGTSSTASSSTVSSTTNYSSIVPSSTANRTNLQPAYGSCINTYKKNVSISLWDSGIIDGDIVSFYVNGVLKVSSLTLDGPDNKYTFNVTLDYDGYNYLVLFAHNEGTRTPNTSAVSVDGQIVEMSSDLYTNGTLDVVVNSSTGVTCQ